MKVFRSFKIALVRLSELYIQDSGKRVWNIFHENTYIFGVVYFCAMSPFWEIVYFVLPIFMLW